VSDGPRIRPVGDRGVLVELGGNDEVHRFAALARKRHGDVLADVVAGHRTVLLAWHRPPVDSGLVAALAGAGDESGALPAPDPVTVPVAYDGPDLGEVARLTGTSPEDVVRRHAAAEYRVAFIGFAPGFAYLLGGDPSLEVPRRDDPRERVPAGSVAVAGRYSAIYPAASPGGWRLIGRTSLLVFDPAREPPALLEPGTPVRFKPERP
jgi:KipI family sensor histidine kinase inhibitor